MSQEALITPTDTKRHAFKAGATVANRTDVKNRSRPRLLTRPQNVIRSEWTGSRASGQRRARAPALGLAVWVLSDAPKNSI
jgi:hypothetical protein